MHIEQEVIDTMPGRWTGRLVCNGVTFDVEVEAEEVEKGVTRWRLDLVHQASRQRKLFGRWEIGTIEPLVEGTEYPSLEAALADAHRLVRERVIRDGKEG